jgi:nucleotide-binding universal stress UspA family protein
MSFVTMESEGSFRPTPRKKGDSTMIERVVVPVDVTSESEWAICPAIRFAEWSATELELISVVAPSERPRIEHRLAALAVTAGKHGATCRIVECDGHPEAVLMSEMRRRRNALWCIGSHARSAVGELLHGSVSEDIVRDVGFPVVLVGPQCVTAPKGRVLAVALDGTAPSEAIMPSAVELAKALGMTVRLLQVGSNEPMSADARETAYLARTAHKVPAMVGGPIDFEVLQGRHPAHELADYLASYPEIGLVTMATRGLRGVDRLRRGSTAFELARHAVVPVAVGHVM